MKRLLLTALLAALPLVSGPAASAQQPVAHPQTARNVPTERVPSLEQQQRDRLNEEHERRLRQYLESVARMA